MINWKELEDSGLKDTSCTKERLLMASNVALEGKYLVRVPITLVSSWTINGMEKENAGLQMGEFRKVLLYMINFKKINEVKYMLINKY